MADELQTTLNDSDIAIIAQAIRSVVAEEKKSIMASVEAMISALPAPKEGEKGAQGDRGSDGNSPSVSDIVEGMSVYIERDISKALLDLEIRNSEKIEKAMALIRQPVDGEKAKREQMAQME